MHDLARQNSLTPEQCARIDETALYQLAMFYQVVCLAVFARIWYGYTHALGNGFSLKLMSLIAAATNVPPTTKPEHLNGI